MRRGAADRGGRAEPAVAVRQRGRLPLPGRRRVLLP